MKKIFSAISDYWNSYSCGQKIFILLLWSIGIHLPICLGNYIVHDDQYTILLTQQSFWQMLQHIAGEDGHPPLSYIFFRLFAFGDLETRIHLMRFAGIVSFLVGSVLLGYYPLRRLTNDKTVLWFVFLMLFMPVSFYFTTIIRMYPLACLCMTGAFIYAQNITWKYRKSDWIYLSIFTVAGLYLHYYCALTSALIWTILLWDLWRQQRCEQIKQIFIYGAITAVCFLPWVFVFVNQYMTMKSDWFPTLDVAESSVFGFIDFYINNSLMSFEYLKNYIFGAITIGLMLFCCFSKFSADDAVNAMIRRAVAIMFGLYALGWGISVLLRPMLCAHYFSVVKGIFNMVLALALMQYKRFAKLYLILSLPVIFISYEFYYTYTHKLSLLQMQAVVRENVQDDSLIMYEESHSHLFLRTYFPQTTRYYAPLEPELVLLQDEIRQEDAVLENLSDYDDKMYYMKKCGCVARCYLDADEDCFEKCEAGFSDDESLGMGGLQIGAFCLYKLSPEDAQKLIENARPYRQKVLQ